MLVKDEKKQEKMDEIDGDQFRYFLLAGKLTLEYNRFDVASARCRLGLKLNLVQK